MNIKQALKQKNKLIKEISENTKLMQQYNSIEEGNERPYNIGELFFRVKDMITNFLDKLCIGPFGTNICCMVEHCFSFGKLFM